MEKQDILEFIKNEAINERDVAERLDNLIYDLNETLEIRLIEDIPEVIQATIFEYCDGKESEVKECLMEFVEGFNEDHNKYINNLREMYDEYCDKNSFCKHCLCELETKSYPESRGEYFGVESYEEIYQPYCPNGCY